MGRGLVTRFINSVNKLINTKLKLALLAAVLAVAIFLLYRSQTYQEKVSTFGRYHGYSEARYDGFQCASDYLTLADGTRLAYDLILPSKHGVPASEPLPVLFKYTPYLRTFTIFDKDGKNIIAGLFTLDWKETAMLRLRYWLSGQGRLMGPLFRTRWLENLVKHGYAVIVVERPGTGASFGVMDPSFDVGAKEADEILNWIASRPWCDGNIGMFGDSMQAMIQFAAASAGNRRLKALFPTSSPMDLYGAVSYPGGVYNKAFGAFFAWSVTFLESVITPVDSDKDGALLAEARKERTRLLAGTVSRATERCPYRDCITEGGKNLWQDRAALYPLIDRINQSGIPVYMTNGWYDIFTCDMFFWHNNLTTPKRLIVRPLDHSGVEKSQFDLDFGAEAHRWFDRWLKGIDNGIMDEPSIHYYVMGAPGKQAWQTSSQWPVKNVKVTQLFLGRGATGSIGSINDGSLTAESPADADVFDAYTVDYTTTTGKKSRWSSVNWPRDYPDMQTNDKKALTYTSSPLEKDVEVTGHPVAHLWLTTDTSDLDAFVYLEEVDGNGKSTYITEGNLRASHRKLSQAPFNNMGLPFHSHYQSDLTPIRAGEPAELIFSLLPTSYRFQKGKRIRITITFADADNFETPVIDPRPNVRLLRDKERPSFVQLPIVH